jgi:1-acyl-sn-glycerol-3-phosphate acyltransferase
MTGQPDHTPPEKNHRIFRIVKLMGRLFLPLIFRIRVEGAGRLPAHQAFILVPKHQRWVDIPILGLVTPRPLYYIAKFELFINPLTGRFLSALGGIPINRKRPIESRRSLKRMMELLGQGQGIVIFPEGTYYRERMGAGHVGLIRMVSTRRDLPFVPVGLQYKIQRWRTLVVVKFGEQIQKDSNMGPEALLGKIMAHISRLSGLDPHDLVSLPSDG